MRSSMHVLRLRRSVISVLLALLYLTGCYSWQVGAPTPAQFVEREHPESVRVTRTDGSTFILESPAVRGDSLVGLAGGRLISEDSTRATSMALRDVTSVAVRETSASKILLLTSVIVVGGLAVASIISCAEDTWC
jgi:hypothetical protein